MAEAIRPSPSRAPRPDRRCEARRHAVPVVRRRLFAAPPTAAQIEVYQFGRGGGACSTRWPKRRASSRGGGHARRARTAARRRGRCCGRSRPPSIFCFYGLGGPRTVPPYESAYTSERGLLFQRRDRTDAPQMSFARSGIAAVGPSAARAAGPSGRSSSSVLAELTPARRTHRPSTTWLSSRATLPAGCRLLPDGRRAPTVRFYAAAADLLDGALARLRATLVTVPSRD